MKCILKIFILVLLITSVYSQGFNYDRNIGIELSNKKFNYRIVLLDTFPKFYGASSSIASTYQKDKKQLKISSNLLFSSMMILSHKIGGSHGISIPIFILYLPQMVGNINYDIYDSPYFSFKLSQRTDYYFFYKISKIYTESAAGFKIKTRWFHLGFDVKIPLTKGYGDNKNPFFGINFTLINALKFGILEGL